MTVVFVHGNPETTAIWGPLLGELGRGDVVTLSPPGFGAPVPPGFLATSDAYLGWLVDALLEIEPPIDLVGHDWGGLHVLRVAATRPDLIRSWCSDSVGALDPLYVWHDLAHLWQSPGQGEAAVEALVSAPFEDKVTGLIHRGMTREVAESCATALSPDWGPCMLRLSRSAIQPAMVAWGEELEKAEHRPGLAVIATLDELSGGQHKARRSAARFGAETAVLSGLGHMWMLEDPVRAAAPLRAFLDSLPPPPEAVAPTEAAAEPALHAEPLLPR